MDVYHRTWLSINDAGVYSIYKGFTIYWIKQGFHHCNHWASRCCHYRLFYLPGNIANVAICRGYHGDCGRNHRSREEWKASEKVFAWNWDNSIIEVNINENSHYTRYCDRYYRTYWNHANSRKGDANYREKTKRNSINLTVIYAVVILLSLIAVGVYIKMYAWKWSAQTGAFLFSIGRTPFPRTPIN